MSDFYNTVIEICIAFLSTEIISYVFPQEKSLKWCINIITVYIFISAVIGFGNFENIFNWEYESDYKADINVSDVYLSETEKILSERIEVALKSVYVETESIEPLLKIDNKGNIYMDSLMIKLKYKSDIERARVVVNELFKYSDEFKREITADG